MSFLRIAVVAGVFVACASLIGCSTGDKEEETVASAESELRLSGTRYLGKIESGETRTGYYYNPPRHRSFAFDAKGGDAIRVDVKSAEGDAVAYVTDASYNVLALNDDASGDTLDSQIEYAVPAGKPAGSYRIVFRDYDLQDATFTVKLEIKSDSSNTTCAYDGETYQEGETFPSTDGCNTCTCESGGTVSCTKQACSCDPANEPWRNYMGTPEQCLDLHYTCPSGWTSFANSCGCGCEQK